MNVKNPLEFKFYLNVPNTLTLSRCVLAVPIALLLYRGTDSSILAAGILLVIASVTDWLDGFTARRLGQTSVVGSVLDVVADEILFIPTLILAIAAGLFDRTAGLVLLNPYLYAVPALAGGVTVLTGVGFFLWKRRGRMMEFPTPPGVAKVNYCFWLAPLIAAVLKIGPDWLLAALMYIAFITTVMSFYTYLRKGGYVFTD